ncbi:hypothetical protein HYS95_02475 [Candidatus Daviesbacteria bacterium]|nr:hypothetical protein [Candidatus Daviesbacteria bacterium]
MIRLLPFILIPILILGGLWYFRFSAGKSNPVTSLITQEKEEEVSVEVPKTVPGATTEERVQSLEDTLTKLVPQVNALKSGGSQSSSSNDSKIAEIEAVITDLKVRVAALEKATPAPVAASGSKYPLYIPLGSGGTVATNSWTNLSTFQISLDPDQYKGYTSMQLEVNMRLNQPGGTLYAQLVNNSSGSTVSSAISTTSTNSSIVTSSTFTLGSGNQTYVLQAKTSDATQGFLDTARIKVNF